MRKDMQSSAEEILDVGGLKNVRSLGLNPVPGGCIHEMGTARMGNDPKASVLNRFNQCHDVPNVFITDGSCMVSTALAYLARDAARRRTVPRWRFPGSGSAPHTKAESALIFLIADSFQSKTSKRIV